MRIGRAFSGFHNRITRKAEGPFLRKDYFFFAGLGTARG